MEHAKFTHLGRAIVGTMVGLSWFALATPVAHAEYPTRPITLVVPFPAGGVTDAQGRTMARELEARLGQPVVVENRAGAAGFVGARHVARSAKPDGYTLGYLSTAALAGAPHMQPTDFDPLEDLDYIISITGYALGLSVRADAPWQNIEEFIEAADKSGEFTYATSGVGGATHLAMEQLAVCKNINLNHVPYKGGADSSVALLGGHVDSQNDSWGALADTGKARLLLVTTPDRSAFQPDIPTLSDLCPEVFIDRAVLGIVSPAGLDPDIKKKLYAAFKDIQESDALKEVLTTSKQQPIFMNSEEFGAYTRKLYEEKGDLLRNLGLAHSG